MYFSLGLWFCSTGIFWCQCCIVLITMALNYILKSGRAIPPALYFMFRIVLAIQDLLWLHMKFRIVFFIFMKNEMGISLWLRWICKWLWAKYHFHMLILLIHEHGSCFRFPVPFYVSFFKSFHCKCSLVPWLNLS